MIPNNFYRFTNVRELERNGENVTYEAEYGGKHALLIGWKSADKDQALADRMELASEGELFYEDGSYFLVSDRESAERRLAALQEHEFFKGVYALSSLNALAAATIVPRSQDTIAAEQVAPGGGAAEFASHTPMQDIQMKDQLLANPQPFELKECLVALLVIIAATICSKIYAGSQTNVAGAFRVSLLSVPANLPGLIIPASNQFSVSQLDSISEQQFTSKDGPDVVAVPLVWVIKNSRLLRSFHWRIIWLPERSPGSEKILGSSKLAEQRSLVAFADKATDGDSWSATLIKQYFPSSKPTDFLSAQTMLREVKKTSDSLIAVHEPLATQIRIKYDLTDLKMPPLPPLLLYSTAILAKSEVIENRRKELVAFLSQWLTKRETCSRLKSATVKTIFDQKITFLSHAAAQDLPDPLSVFQGVFQTLEDTPSEELVSFFYKAGLNSCPAVARQVGYGPQVCDMVDKTFLEDSEDFRTDMIAPLNEAMLEAICLESDTARSFRIKIAGFQRGSAVVPQNEQIGRWRPPGDKLSCAVGYGDIVDTDEKNNTLAKARAKALAESLRPEEKANLIICSRGKQGSTKESAEDRRVELFSLDIPANLRSKDGK